MIDYCPEDPQTRSGRIYDRNSQRGRADDGKWTLARAITSHHPYRWIPSRPLSDVFRCPLDASEDCGGAPDDSGTLNFQCPPLLAILLYRLATRPIWPRGTGLCGAGDVADVVNHASPEEKEGIWGKAE